MSFHSQFKRSTAALANSVNQPTTKIGETKAVFTRLTVLILRKDAPIDSFAERTIELVNQNKSSLK